MRLSLLVSTLQIMITSVHGFLLGCSQFETCSEPLFGIPVAFPVCTIFKQDVCAIVPLFWLALGGSCGSCGIPVEVTKRDTYEFTFASAPETPIPFIYGGALARITNSYYETYAFDGFSSSRGEIASVFTSFVSAEEPSRTSDTFEVVMSTTVYFRNNTELDSGDIDNFQRRFSDLMDDALEEFHIAEYLQALQDISVLGFFNEIDSVEYYG